MESLLRCRKFEVVRELVSGKDGNSHTREYVMHPGAVVILPLLNDDECLVLRQVRPAVDQTLWELPAGTLDVPGESPEAAAARELEEETGHRAERLERLCEFFPSPGVLSERIIVFVATRLTEARQKLGPTEQILGVERVRIADLYTMIREGRIVDGKTILTLLRWDMEKRARLPH